MLFIDQVLPAVPLNKATYRRRAESLGSPWGSAPLLKCSTLPARLIFGYHITSFPEEAMTEGKALTGPLFWFLGMRLIYVP